MIAKYKENPEKYIRETCRLNPPVTSATTTLPEETKVTMNNKEYTMPKGLLNQYVLSMANRDPTKFSEPHVFNPDRRDLNKALTWNGPFGDGRDQEYLRMCPGASMSLSIIEMIANHALNFTRLAEAGV